jgi:hypothetical protein
MLKKIKIRFQTYAEIYIKLHGSSNREIQFMLM